jgi:hypothetical protein
MEYVIWSKFRTSMLILMSVLSHTVLSQQIVVDEFKPLPLDISAREKVIKDPNGDVCSIIKVRVGLQGISFSADLGINKSEFHDGEYWLWVPPGTLTLSIEAPSYPKTDFKLPVFTEEYNVYMVFLSVTAPEKTEYLTSKNATFTTKPRHAQVFINDIYYGVTPLQADIPLDTLRYSIRKKKFLPVTVEYSSLNLPLSYHHCLEKDPKANRFFMLVSAGYGLQSDGLFGGISMGALGNTGYYVTLLLGKLDPIIIEKDNIRTGYIAGINRRIAKNLFLNLGVLLINPNKSNNRIGTVGLNGGIIIRTNKRLLISLQVDSDLQETGIERVRIETDLSAGIGYNF